MLRTTPYTALMLPKVPCIRCGKPSGEQWALKPDAVSVKRWVGVCLEHHTALNRQVLQFFNIPEGKL